MFQWKKFRNIFNANRINLNLLKWWRVMAFNEKFTNIINETDSFRVIWSQRVHVHHSSIRNTSKLYFKNAYIVSTLFWKFFLLFSSLMTRKEKKNSHFQQWMGQMCANLRNSNYLIDISTQTIGKQKPKQQWQMN